MLPTNPLGPRFRQTGLFKMNPENWRRPQRLAKILQERKPKSRKMRKQVGPRESMVQKCFFSIRIAGSCSRGLPFVSSSGFLVARETPYSSCWECWPLMVKLDPLENCSV